MTARDTFPSRAEIAEERRQFQLEHDARYGREVVARLEALMQRHREGDRIEYADLVAVVGVAS